MKKRQTYDERANQFVRAVDIIQTVVMASMEFQDAHKAVMKQGFEEMKRMSLNPEPQFRRIASLRYLEEHVLGGWSDATGPDADRVWAEIQKQGLPYHRKDVLAVVLKRKRIKDQHEFDYVTDNIVIAEQENRITKEQAVALDAMLMKFQGR
ncbi:MAG: hypothetical protein IPJ85_15325 [Flavobacteriales bacterium]|nr:hypothetical protein [Flavobacteriales bacterium]